MLSAATTRRWTVLGRSGVLALGLWLALAPAPRTAWAAAPRGVPQFAELVERNRAAVVNIRAQRYEPERVPMRPSLPEHGYRRDRELPPGHPELDDSPDRAQGSGFVISPDGYILTNAHVVARADEVVVRLADRREFPARVIGADRRTDIALLKIPATGLSSVALGKPGELREGDWVLAIGSPFGFEQSVTAGIVSARSRSLPQENFVRFIQTDVAINPGNSGGPLFNVRGEVVGINSQIFSRTGGFMGLAFSIPIDVAMTIQQQLRERGTVRRGRIGVVIQEVSPELAQSFGLAEPAGALVSAVQEDLPASRAGVLQGDIVLAFDGRKVSASADLPLIVAATEPGREVDLLLWREGAEQRLRIGVAELREEQSEAAASAPEAGLEHDRLGLVVIEPNRLQRRQMRIDNGVMVERRTGRALASDLRYGDAIEAIVIEGRRREIASLAAYRELIAGLPAGATVSLLVRRAGQASFLGMRVD